MSKTNSPFKTADQIRREKGLTGRPQKEDRTEERQNWREYQRALAEANRKPGEKLTKPVPKPKKYVTNPTVIETPAFHDWLEGKS